METKIVVALIISIGSFVGIVVNIIYSAVIASRQNNLELKKTRIELLENRRIKIEQKFDYMLSQSLKIKEFDGQDHKLEKLALDIYLNWSDAFACLVHYFPDEYFNVQEEIKQCISDGLSKGGKTILASHKYEELTAFRGKVQYVIRNKLHEIEQQIQELLKP